jgi:tetratricopeptide (TPR) repeat protein
MSRRDWLLALAVVVITFLVYAPAWNGKPIWDDEIHITRPQLRSLSGLARIWTDPSAAPQYYPVLHTLFWLEYKLWDGAVLPYHLVAIFCHALLALLLMLILRRLRVPGAWLAVFVFALHPVHVESVAWLSEIKNTLSGVFAAAAMLAYLRYDENRARGAYLLALILFALALLTKSAIVGLPAVLLVVFWWNRGSLSWRRDFVPMLPLFAIGAATGAVTIWVEQKFCALHGETFNFSMLDRCLAAGRLFWFYLGKIFWPANLSLIYPAWTIDSANWWQYLFPIAALALLIATWLIRHRSRGPLCALLCFVGLIFPVLGFFNLSFFMTTTAAMPHSAIFRADHFQYFADIPIIALVCAGAGLLWKQTRGRRFHSLLAPAWAIVLILFAFLTSAQSRTYRDTETCFRDVLAKNPESATAHNNLANVLKQRGAFDEAISHYRRALEIDPDYQFGRYNLGATLVQKGELASAIPQLEAALERDPNYPKAYYSLGTALAQTGRPDEAVIAYNRALHLQPDFVDAHTNLANLLLERGDIDGAILHYRKALELDPNSPMTHYNLAVGLARSGHNMEAIVELQTVLRLQPDYPDAGELLNNLQARAPQR